MTTVLSPAPVLRVYDNAGNLAISGSVYTYIAGTSTPTATYTDSTGVTPNTNPIILNSRGECSIWLAPTQAYKIVAYDASANLLWSKDNIVGASTSSNSVWYNQGSIGAITRTVQDRLQVSVSVKDWGATGNGTTDDTAAFLAARNSLQTNANFRGGTIHVPRGHYKLSAAWDFTAYAAGNVHNMFIVGDGADNTVLDWTGAIAGTNGVTFNSGAHFGIEGLVLVNAPGINLLINNGSLNTANYCNQFYVRNVRMQGAGSDNFRCFNGYMGEIANCWSFGAGGLGYTFAGFHTSMKISRNEANANTSGGWSINGMVYSEFSCCGSDSNLQEGWVMSNINGVVFDACGAEQNQKDAFKLLSSTASTTGIPTDAQDIHGVVFNGCYATGNSAAIAGAYGSFITAATADSRPIEFAINGGKAIPNTVSDKALILAGTSGTINCVKTQFYDNGFTALDSYTGTVRVSNLSTIGRLTLATLSAATVSISDNTLTTLSLSTTPSYNDLGVSISSNDMIIPRGVNRVRVSVNVQFAANATGARQVFLQKNGVNIIGQASCAESAASVGPTILTASSPVMVVTPGDYFSAQIYQSSGGALDVVQGSTTYLCVEAVC